MTRRKPSRLEDMASMIDVRLGDILGQLGSALDEAADRLEQGEGSEIRRERQFDTGKGPVRASVGLRIRTLGGEAPQTGRRPETPINTPTPAKPTRPDPTPRLVDATVFNEPGQFSLVADVPGIQRGHVSWSVEGALLRVDAKSDSRHYRIETDLPDDWQEATFDCAVQNGILELSATREDA
jgi:HSP20 family molecular chaperone IbpA